MKLPKEYENLTIEQKKIVVDNIIHNFWDKKIRDLTEKVWDSQVEFLFDYFFTEEDEEREKKWYNMQQKYNELLVEIESIVKELQKLDLKCRELIKLEDDAKDIDKISKNFTDN